MINTINLFPSPPVTKRSCGECTKCCEGYLRGEAHGHKFFLGTPCYFLKEGKCSIYPQRPDKPCKNYSCYWLDNLEVPDSMRPDKSSVIMTSKEHNGLYYIQVIEAGKKIDSSILAEIIRYTHLTNQNIEFQVDGKQYHLGSPEFMQMVIQETVSKRTQTQNI